MKSAAQSLFDPPEEPAIPPTPADAPLAEDFAAGTFRCLELEEYGEILAECLRQFPDTAVVYRITGDGARRGLIAPMWSLDKKRVLNYLNDLLSGYGLLDQRGL